MPHVQPTPTPELLATLQDALRLLARSISRETLGPQILCAFERMVHEVFAWAADTFFATFLFCLLEHTDFEHRVIRARRASSPVRLHVHEKRRVTLTLLAGHLVTLEVRALRARGPKKGRPRTHTKRGKAQGHRATPVLQVLGFVRRRSAATCFEILEASASLEAYDKAQRRLARQGVKLCKDSLLADVDALGTLAFQAHESWLHGASSDGPLTHWSARERRVVVSFDGGRLRERIDHMGRKKKNGYRDFEAPWVEPRQLVVYALDEEGKLDESLGRVVLGSLDEVETLFERIPKFLRALGLSQASQVVVSADGQHWQWERLTGALVEAGVARERIVEVLDLGHALGRVNELAHLPKSWGQAQRVRWYLKSKDLLKAGRIPELIQRCTELAKGRRFKTAKSLTSYFIKHRERMQYADFRARSIPCGSGVVESTIRQVVNMRLKGCGKFWTRARAERMLMLRGWLVCGRLEDLWRFALRHRVAWWYDAMDESSSGVQPCAA